MKLTDREKRELDLLRALDTKQRDKLLEQMERQVLANRITERVAGRKLRIVDDKKIERAFGAPRWKHRGKP
ncbi:MAG TPA: hypothetical protein VJ797_15675 [Burkholderiales bacterium]|nr:hypothetical protein [Burkholderiales bacterium]